MSIRARLGADAVIPVRAHTKPFKGKPEKGPKGKYRKMTAKDFDRDAYNKRPLVETVNSMIKRTMGDSVYGHSGRTRHVEILCRCIAHNIMRSFAMGVEA